MLNKRITRSEFLRIAAKAAGLSAAWPLVGGLTRAAPALADQGDELPETVFDKLIKPFVNEAGKRRAERQANDQDYQRRVDPELNDGRVNFLLFGQGETFEPPFEKVGIIGSHTVLSYNTTTKQADVVSITHDTRAPEIERYVQRAQNAKEVHPIKIDQAYNIGSLTGGTALAGFSLMRKVLEDATGLSIDFQAAFWDEAIVGLVSHVFGKVKINVPKTFQVNPFYFKGKRYPAGQFTEGEQELDGLQAIQFIKTVVIEDTEYPDPELEHNVRKHLLFKSMFEQWRGIDNVLQRSAFLGKMLLFFIGSVNNNTITYDFDSTSLLINNMKTVIDGLKSLVFGGSSDQLEPEVGKTIYVVDKRQGDGGVRWVKGNDDPLIQEEFDKGFYLDRNMEVPVGGNPYADDLIEGYWASVRALVRSSLLARPASGEAQ
ncbi:MAG: LCP family protein [Bacteroidetes bacterium]|nr:LCP family protein [Bacteroidota bacterium]